MVLPQSDGTVQFTGHRRNAALSNDVHFKYHMQACTLFYCRNFTVLLKEKMIV